MNVKYKYIIDERTHVNHPNTADIDIIGVNGHTLSVRGESIGGGKMKIVRIDNIEVEFTGEYSTLIVHQQDKPGVIAHITQALSEQNVNIAFMRLFREKKGENAYTVVESDEHIPEEIRKAYEANKKSTTLSWERVLAKFNNEKTHR
jgi:L-serine dehydratase